MRLFKNKLAGRNEDGKIDFYKKNYKLKPDNATDNSFKYKAIYII